MRSVGGGCEVERCTARRRPVTVRQLLAHRREWRPPQRRAAGNSGRTKVPPRERQHSWCTAASTLTCIRRCLTMVSRNPRLPGRVPSSSSSSVAAAMIGCRWPMATEGVQHNRQLTMDDVVAADWPSASSSSYAMTQRSPNTRCFGTRVFALQIFRKKKPSEQHVGCAQLTYRSNVMFSTVLLRCII